MVLVERTNVHGKQHDPQSMRNKMYLLIPFQNFTWCLHHHVPMMTNFHVLTAPFHCWECFLFVKTFSNCTNILEQMCSLTTLLSRIYSTVIISFPSQRIICKILPIADTHLFFLNILLFLLFLCFINSRGLLICWNEKMIPAFVSCHCTV